METVPVTKPVYVSRPTTKSILRTSAEIKIEDNPSFFFISTIITISFVFAIVLSLYQVTTQHRNKIRKIKRLVSARLSLNIFSPIKSKAITSTGKHQNASSCKRKQTFNETLHGNVKNKGEILTEAVIGATGGSLSCENFTLIIPTGALKTSTNIRISTLPQENISSKGKNYFSISKILRCEPSGLNFLKPYTVILNTCYLSIGEKDSIPLQVFVRKHNGDLWTKESQTALGSDGKITFTAQHFSDRVPQPEENFVSSLAKSLRSIGFSRFLSSSRKEINWYVMDGDEETFQRIKSLNKDAETEIQYETFIVQINWNLKLSFQLTNSDLITLDRNQVSIDQSQFRQESVALSNKFLLSRNERYTFSDDEVITLSYSIVETQNSDVRYANVTENKVRLSGRFYFTWNLKSKPQSPSIVPEAVVQKNSNLVGFPISSTCLINLPQSQERLSNHSTASWMEYSRSERAINPSYSYWEENKLQKGQRQKLHVKPPPRLRHYSTSSSDSNENSSLLQTNASKTSTHGHAKHNLLESVKSSHMFEGENTSEVANLPSSEHQSHPNTGNFQVQKKRLHSINKVDDNSIKLPDNSHAGKFVPHSSVNFSSSDVEPKSDSDPDDYQRVTPLKFMTYI